MLDSHETTLVDDFGLEHNYSTHLYPAGEGFKLLPIIVKMASGPIGDLIDAIGTDGLNADIDGAKLSSALGGIAQAIIAEGSEEFLKRILKYTIRDSAKVPLGFDKAYQGNYGELFAAIAWVLMKNYGPFFQRHLAGGLSQVKARLASVSTD